MIVPPGYERVRDRRLALVVRADVRPWLEPVLRQIASGQDQPGARALPGGRGGTVVIDRNGHTVVVRAARRGGLPARLVRDLHFGFAPWPFRELVCTVALQRAGVPVAEPLGAAVLWMAPGCYRGWFASRYIAGAQTLSAWARAATGPLRTRLLRLVGAATRRLHASGQRHPDLNLDNILLTDAGGGSVWLVDFDRGWRGAGATDDLRRLRRSARKLDPQGRWLTDADLALIESGYRDAD